MDAASQLTLLRTKLGEPVDTALARFTPAQLISGLNEGRQFFAEYTNSVQIRYSQTTNPGNVPTAFYSLPNDVIEFWAVEFDGYNVEPVQPRDWRNRIGRKDDIQGIPSLFKYYMRRLQLYPVPNAQKILRVEGYGYPVDLQVDGADPDLTDQQARASIWWAAFILKGADERENSFELDNAKAASERFRKQYKPRGPRMIRDATRRTSVLGWILNG